MIDLIDVSIQFTGVPLFDSTNIKINKGDKIALVGANGTGKSTILKLIAGLEETSTGKIQKQKNISSGYLPQEYLNTSTKSVFEEVKQSLEKVHAIELKETELHEIISDSKISETERERAINELGKLENKKTEIDFYSINSQIEKVLEGLGFTVADFQQPVSTYSGGWQMRIELAKILLGNHDIILLDEPTNHLDLDSLQWLINFLMNYKGALLLVSHDRYFVNKLTTRTLEIFNKKLTLYNGNYDAYLRFKEERDKQLIANFQSQERKRKQTEDFVERFRYKATKAKQVQSRIKQLNKLEEIELPEFEGKINLRFPEPPRSGSIPIDIKALTKQYDDNLVFKNFDFRIERGDKIAFVGPNGAGKTTLAKIIANKINFNSGEMIVGHNAIISYYAQEVTADLDLESDVLDCVMQSSIESTPQQIRTILGSFLFTNDDVFKKVKVLSGGEKSRVALAKILLTKANLIVLDEPTNHLDYNSKLVLQDALVNFSGSLIIVSHDVDFLKPIVNKVLEIRKLKTTLFAGGIDYYFTKRESIIEKEDTPTLGKVSENNANRKDQKRFDAENRKKRYEATKILKKEVLKLESEIELLEAQIEALEIELGDEKVYSNPQLSAKKNKEYENSKNILEKIYSIWTDKSEELENIEQEFN
ncbi:MAG: ABC-F family ATP-binding cassette domain-containing protein [Bacteroidetes bacterium]|nr:ABC-F family ATP-binding cassette domain-containing protein [Bacteroidota bacterium]MBU1113553.1 ABC-F family ATP-binding cassette domain-containing protein [Bacteroidota bacterium]MBU1800285.1 ABC-F family ATP-binding cassette domain-containing protein [Bacteroidota bacterium]